MKISKHLMRKLLITSSSYDTSEIYFLSSLLVNNSYKPAIKACPSEVIFGSRSIELGSLGINRGSPATKSALVEERDLKPQIEALRKAIDARVTLCRRALKFSRLTYQKRYNKHRQATHPFQVNDIVFVIDKTQSPTGTSPKFRPILYKSPFIVLDIEKLAVTVQRISDNLRMRISAERLRKFNAKDPIFGQLPDEVTKIVGTQLTPQSLAAKRYI